MHQQSQSDCCKISRSHRVCSLSTPSSASVVPVMKLREKLRTVALRYATDRALSACCNPLEPVADSMRLQGQMCTYHEHSKPAALVQTHHAHSSRLHWVCKCHQHSVQSGKCTGWSSCNSLPPTQHVATTDTCMFRHTCVNQRIEAGCVGSGIEMAVRRME